MYIIDYKQEIFNILLTSPLKFPIATVFLKILALIFSNLLYK